MTKKTTKPLGAEERVSAEIFERPPRDVRRFLVAVLNAGWPAADARLRRRTRTYLEQLARDLLARGPGRQRGATAADAARRTPVDETIEAVIGARIRLRGTVGPENALAAAQAEVAKEMEIPLARVKRRWKMRYGRGHKK